MDEYIIYIRIHSYLRILHLSRSFKGYGERLATFQSMRLASVAYEYEFETSTSASDKSNLPCGNSTLMRRQFIYAMLLKEINGIF